MKKIHRYISFFLCLAVILFCISSPLQHTASADAATVSISMGGTFVSVSGAIAVAVLVLSGLGILWGSIEEAVAEAKLWYNAVPKIVKDWLDKAGQEVVEGHTTVKIPETVIEGINSVDEAHQLSPSSPYLDTSGFNLDTISPTDLFAQDVVGAIQQSGSTTHSLLRTLYGLLNTGFADLDQTFTSEISSVVSSLSTLGNKIGTLQSTLSGSLSDVELSTDLIRTTLSKDLSDLKTVYSSFGNATLDKLDTLNTSIQNLGSLDSTDFLNLYNLIAQNDSLTLKALQNLPGQISDSISSYFETQSLQLESISDKLGAESSYLFDLVGDMQILRDEVINGFADTVVALDQLDVTADINLQPLIDQLFDTEATFVGQFDSLYSLINDNIAAYSAANNEFLASIESLLVDNWDQMIIDYSEAIIEQLVYLDLFNWEQLFPGIESLLDSSFSSLVSEFDDLESLLSGDSALISSFDSVSIPLTELLHVVNADVLGSLDAIKTSLLSIAGTTTADPSPGGNNSQDDYEKEKAPLMPWVGSGFEIGESYFNSIQGFLGDDMDAFLVAGMIFEEFAGMTFFYKLIIISCSVGLIGTLLGMALQLQSYSVAQRRREEAAQSKAHNRMERSYAA